MAIKDENKFAILPRTGVGPTVVKKKTGFDPSIIAPDDMSGFDPTFIEPIKAKPSGFNPVFIEGTTPAPVEEKIVEIPVSKGKYKLPDGTYIDTLPEFSSMDNYNTTELKALIRDLAVDTTTGKMVFEEKAKKMGYTPKMIEEERYAKLGNYESFVRENTPSGFVQKGLASLAGPARKRDINAPDDIWKMPDSLPDTINKAIEYPIPNTLTVPFTNIQFKIGGPRQEGTLALEGEKGYAERFWEFKQSVVAEAVDWSQEKLKTVLGKDLYDAIGDTTTMQGIKTSVDTAYTLASAGIGVGLEMLEFASTPEGIAQLILFKKALGGVAKVSALADIKAPLETGVTGKVQAVARNINKVGEPALDLWKKKMPRSYALTQKLVNGHKPKQEEIKAAIDELKQNKPVIDSILSDKEIKKAAELNEFEKKFGEGKTEIYESPKDYAGPGETRMDVTLVNIDELLGSKRLKDTMIRDEKMSLPKIDIVNEKLPAIPEEIISREANVKRTPPTTVDFESLKESVKKEGVKTPVAIDVDPKGNVSVVDGTHRIAAAKAAGKEYIPAKIRYRGMADERFPRLGLDIKKELSKLKITEGERRSLNYKINEEMARILAEKEKAEPVYTLPEDIVKDKPAKPNVVKFMDADGNIPQGEYWIPDPKVITKADLLPEAPKKWWKASGVTPSRSKATLQLMRDLDTSYGVGKFKQRNTAGIFKPGTTVIRTKTAFDQPIVSHEIGHRVADLVFDEYPKGKLKVNPELLKYGDELNRLAYEGAKNLTDEGFAEFIRLLMVNPKNAKLRAPNLYEAFVNKLKTKPDVWSALSKFQQSVHAFAEQSPVGRVHSIQRFQTKAGMVTWLKDYIQKFREDPRMGLSDLADEIGYKWFNDLGHTDRVLRSVGGENALKLYRNDPVVLLRLLGRGKAGRIRAALETGLYDSNYNPIGEGFHVILKEISRPFKDIETGRNFPGMFDEGGFWDYAVTRRAIEFENNFQNAGKPDGTAVNIPLRTLQTAYDNMDNPTYRNIYDRVRKFKRTLDFRTEVIDLQRMTSDEFKKMEANNKERLFPFHRIMDEGVRHLEQGGKAGVRIRKAKGSGRDLVHPYESIVREIANQVVVSDQAIAERKLADLCGTMKGGGGVFEKVPRKTKEIQFKWDEIKRQGSKIMAEELGIPEEITNEMFFDVLNEHTAKIYKAGNLDPMQRIIFRNGKPEVWEYKDQWIKDSFTAADEKTTNVFTMGMQIAAKVARFGITVLNPDFMFRNWTRDTLTRFINTEGNPKMFVPDMAKAFFEAFQGKSEEWKLYQASGGPLSGFYGTDIDAVKMSMQKMEAGNLYYLRHPWQTIMDANSFLEDVSRFAEFKAGYGKQKARSIAENMKAGLKPEQAEAKFSLDYQQMQKREAVLRGGLAAREGTIDFLTSGTAARGLNKYTAFFTANMGGLRKLSLMLKDNPRKTLTRGVLSLTIPTIALYMLNRNNPEYQRKDDYQKWFFFHMPLANGSYVQWPKPPGWGWVFSTQVEEFLNWVDKNEPNSEFMKRLAEAFGNEYVPSILPNGVQGFMAFGANYDWYRGINLLTETDKRLPQYMQAGRFTSESAKFIGDKLQSLPNWKVLDVVKSPKLLEGVGRVQVGGTFRTGLDIADVAGYAAKKAGLVTSDNFNKLPEFKRLPVTRSFLAPPRYVSAPLANNFYDKLIEINQVKNGDSLLSKQKKFAQRSDYRQKNKQLLNSYWTFNAIANVIAVMNKEFRAIELDNKMDIDRKKERLMELGNKIDAQYKRALDSLRQ